MYFQKLILVLSFTLSLSAVAEARGSSSMGRVIRVDGSNVELALSKSSMVGTTYDLRRRRVSPPKSPNLFKRIHVGQVQVTELLGDGRVRALILHGSAAPRDRAFELAGADQE